MSIVASPKTRAIARLMLAHDSAGDAVLELLPEVHESQVPALLVLLLKGAT